MILHQNYTKTISIPQKSKVIISRMNYTISDNSIGFYSLDKDNHIRFLSVNTKIIRHIYEMTCSLR